MWLLRNKVRMGNVGQHEVNYFNNFTYKYMYGKPKKHIDTKITMLPKTGLLTSNGSVWFVLEYTLIKIPSSLLGVDFHYTSGNGLLIFHSAFAKPQSVISSVFYRRLYRLYNFLCRFLTYKHMISITSPARRCYKSVAEHLQCSEKSIQGRHMSDMTSRIGTSFVFKSFFGLP